MINIIDSDLEIGYLPRLETLKKIFIRDTVVTNHDQKCFVMVINAYEEDAKIKIPPQYLEHFNLIDDLEDFFVDDSDSETISPDFRLGKIIDSLRLNHLNDKEKEHIIKIITDYQQIFHLPGEPLSATDVLLTTPLQTYE